MLHDQCFLPLTKVMMRTKMLMEEPTAKAKFFYDLLDSAKRPLWDGCTSGTELSVTAKYITMKSKFNLTEAAFTAVV